ncbi:MAG TPA: hypothetical protein PK622_11630, partial [Saprospiraceae bacterium]|nr:hypothetical protein [Saprospiraceae bacterium]
IMFAASVTYLMPIVALIILLSHTTTGMFSMISIVSAVSLSISYSLSLFLQIIWIFAFFFLFIKYYRNILTFLETI